MTLELIRTQSEFQALKEEWNSLLENSASHVPFLRHEFLSNWWETLGGGEWRVGELAILLRKNSSGDLIGIAPFFLSGGRLMFLGSHEISDYLDLISKPEDLTGLVEDTVKFLENGDILDWEILDLYNLLEDSPTLPLLRDNAHKFGYRLEEKILQPAPYIPLPDTWQGYLDNLKDRYRREIEKKLTGAYNYFLPVSWYIADDPEMLDSEMDDFLGLMANHPGKEQFLTPEMIVQQKNSAREAFQAGWLQLAFLQVGDIKAAGYLNFDFNDQIWVYNSGINTLFENISPGWVLLGKIIQKAIEDGKRALDFMRGDEPYKYQFGGIDKKVLRVQISR